MGAGTKSSTSRIAVIVIVIPLLAGAWFLLPMFLPMWRWMNVDFKKIATEAKVPEARLMQEFQLEVRYAPRGEDERDPAPWQIIVSNPEWSSIDPDNRTSEEKILVRCAMVNERNGESPSNFLLGSGGEGGWKDRYFRVRAWRLPPGTFGKGGGKRPVLLYRADTLEKLGITPAQGYFIDLKSWENDDDWDGRADGFRPATAAAAAD